MDKEIDAYLWENERMLWKGKPSEFPLLDSGTKIEILCKWIVTVAVFGGVMLYNLSMDMAWGKSFLILVCICSVLMIISPIIERENLRGYQYWITDQRVVLMTRDKSLYYMELAKIDGIRVVHDKAVQDCVVLGGCLFKEINKQLRWRACHPKLDLQAHEKMNQALGMVLYCVSNAGAAMNLLSSKCGKQLTFI